MMKIIKICPENNSLRFKFPAQTASLEQINSLCSARPLAEHFIFRIGKFRLEIDDFPIL